ncbi:MAG: hypothetical protein GW893_15655 [Armatimonadetes bacterium]|nr:hypothetical protein [Armatimonadota bacterium]
MHSMEELLTLAGKCHIAWLDPDEDLMPTGGYEVAHDTGRWWDAMLRLENATGFAIPAEIEAAMLRNLHRLMGNPDALLMNDPSVEWLKEKARINPHNFREGLLAVTSLVRFRDSAWARETGHRLLKTMDRCLQSDGRFDFTRLVCWGKVPHTDDPSHDQKPGKPWFDGTANSGRALEAVVWFYEATGDCLALDVAERIARHHLANTVNPDGSVRAEIVDPNNVGHNHSYLGTLRGLLLFGLLTSQSEYVEAVTATYMNSLWRHNITESGWTPHDLGKTRFPDEKGDPVGEHASCGDVAQLALWLALRAGHTELLDDVERLVRARLLPSQTVDENNPRQHGAWGVYSHPFGQGSTLDVFAAVTHSLADIYQHVVTRSAEGVVSVNLHFDIETPWATVQTRRSEKGRLIVEPKQRSEVRLRVPGWAPRETLRLEAWGNPLPLRWEGHYLIVSSRDVPAGAALELAYDLPLRETTEVMPVSRREFRLTWRGDEVAACDPEVPIYPVFVKGG